MKPKRTPEEILEKKRREKDRRLQNVYGVDLVWFLNKSKDGCEICTKKDGVLCVDHIHTKGFKTMPPEEKRKYVRGILCFLCNTALRVFERTKDGKRNRALLEGVSKYFSKYPIKGEIE
jgi:hypothetical protein